MTTLRELVGKLNWAERAMLVGMVAVVASMGTWWTTSIFDLQDGRFTREQRDKLIEDVTVNKTTVSDVKDRLRSIDAKLDRLIERQ